MRIGELSRATRTSIQTLRFYEREKLLREPPAATVPTAQHDLACVRFIRDAQELGFTLKEVRELLKIHETASAASRPSQKTHLYRRLVVTAF